MSKHDGESYRYQNELDRGVLVVVVPSSLSVSDVDSMEAYFATIVASARRRQIQEPVR